jgi:hypothetical protein
MSNFQSSADDQQKLTRPELQDPIEVINTLVSRIHGLERQLQAEREQHEKDSEEVIYNAVRRLRMYGVILLYVGERDYDRTLADLRESSPFLDSTMKEVWLLNKAPVPEAVKSALFSAANGGMESWMRSF